MVATDDGYQYPAQHELDGHHHGPLRWQLDHVVDCIRSGDMPRVGWKDEVESLRIANAVFQSIDNGNPVDL